MCGPRARCSSASSAWRSSGSTSSEARPLTSRSRSRPDGSSPSSSWRSRPAPRRPPSARVRGRRLRGRADAAVHGVADRRVDGAGVGRCGLGRRQLHVRRIWSANRITTPKTLGLAPRGGPSAAPRGFAPGSAALGDGPRVFPASAAGTSNRRTSSGRRSTRCSRAPDSRAYTCMTSGSLCVPAHRPGGGRRVISETMGHSSIRVTFDVYGHLFARTRQQASACLEAALLSTAFSTRARLERNR